MLTFEDAIKIAFAELEKMNKDFAFSQNSTGSSDKLILLEEQTMETSFGWIFFYVNEQWYRTGDMKDAIGGNAPFIIDKFNAEVTSTGTAYPIEYYIDEYEEKRGFWMLILDAKIMKESRNLLKIKKILNLSNQEILMLKKQPGKEVVLEKGSHKRILKLKAILDKKNIHSKIISAYFRD